MTSVEFREPPNQDMKKPLVLTFPLPSMQLVMGRGNKSQAAWFPAKSSCVNRVEFQPGTLYSTIAPPIMPTRCPVKVAFP